MTIKFNMTNCVMKKVGQLSNKSMTAYLECGSTRIAQLSMGGGKPDWFKGPVA